MNKKYPWKQAILTGFIVGVFGIASFCTMVMLNRHLDWGMYATTIRGLTGLLSLVIVGIGIYSGMRSIKRHHNGKLTFGQALLAGFVIALTTGIITALVGWIYCLIDPGYAAYMLSESTKEMAAAGKSPAEIATSMPGLKQQWSTGGQMVQALVGQTVSGTVIALVMGIFVKTKK